VPELPEVETVVRTLTPRLAGRAIAAAVYRAGRAAQGDPVFHSARLAGRRIRSVRRLGKHILLDLDHGLAEIHLRMTGKLLFEGARPAYTRAVLHLDDGAALSFEDVRQFGYIVWRDSEPALGADALNLTLDRLRWILASRRGRLKPLLLNQRVVSGLGNIYVDEALHRAGLHPLTQAGRISSRRAARLLQAIGEVLTAAIAAGGSSISDYVDAEGNRGSFQMEHRVYGRAGEPCLACGTAIRRIVVAQRGTHFCPRCQRA
jgi:formamidopyrimidine-DNA glycosylase